MAEQLSSYNSVMMSVSKSSLHRIGAVRVVRSSVERVLVRCEIRVVWARARRAGSAETLGSPSQPNVVRLKRKIKYEIKEENFFSKFENTDFLEF